MALIGGIGLFYALTLREGHNWDGDYALYIMNARNIVTGAPYDDTKYLHNPQNPMHPASYPPGLPLLLAPIYAWSGIDLQQMKLVGVIMFTLFLGVFPYMAQRYFPYGIALAVTAVVGGHPLFWELKDTIFSELPFIFFCYTALYCVNRLLKTGSSSQPWTILGAAMAMAYSTRTIGLILLPVTGLMALYHRRHFFNAGVGVIILALGFIGLLMFLFPNDLTTYGGYFEDHSLLEEVQENAVRLLRALRIFALWSALGVVGATLHFALECLPRGRINWPPSLIVIDPHFILSLPISGSACMRRPWLNPCRHDPQEQVSRMYLLTLSSLRKGCA